MKTTLLCLVAASLCAVSPIGGQTLAKNVVASDGLVSIVFPSRPTACGDGRTFISNIFGQNRQMYIDGSGYSGRNRWETQPCAHGPARVEATVISGEITRLRAFVGPVPTAQHDARTINATAPEAAAWLSELLTGAPSRVAAQAVLPLMIADAPEPWPLLLRVARDGNRPREVTRSALQWLSTGVTQHLGLENADDQATDDDQLRAQAVFVLSQRAKSESVPELIEVARSSKHPAARKAAIFWLSQSYDPRVADVYAEMLGLKG